MFLNVGIFKSHFLCYNRYDNYLYVVNCQGRSDKLFTGRFEDSKFLIVLESLFIACCVILFVHQNKIIADFICEATQIPFDLALTFTSAGFGNNIIILLLVAEIILAVLIIEKFIPRLIDKIGWGC